MKKAFKFLLILPLLISCTNSIEINESIDVEDQAVYHPLPIAKYNDGYFIQNLNNNALYYIENNQSTFINYCYFHDDQFVEGKQESYKNYESYVDAGMGFYVLDAAIYTLATYRNVEGESWCSLVRMSLDGTKLKELFKLDFQPYNNFTIYKNKVYMIENESNMTIHILSLSGKELKIIKNTYADSFFISSDRIYLRNGEFGHFSYLNEDDEIINIPIQENEYVEMVNNNHISSISYSDENILISHYRSIEDLTDIHLFINEMITYFNDKYIFTSQLKGTQKYRVYDLNANLLKEIIPSKSIQSNITNPNEKESDFSVICRVIDNKIIAFNSKGPIECDFETEVCRFVIQSK